MSSQTLLKEHIFCNTTKGRLDVILSAILGESRNQIERLIANGHVVIDGKVAQKGGVKLAGGEELRVCLPKSAQASAGEYEVDFDVEVLFEDDSLLVLNKPPRVVVHSAPSVKEATLVEWLRNRGTPLSNINGEERWGIVHRLDKETSGAIVVAKNNEAHIALSRQLQDQSMGRYYLALIDCPLKENRLIECTLGRNPKNRLKIAKVAHGRYAKSAFVKLCTDFCDSHELIAAKLFTGRTHQIRAHLELLGRHILNDSLYGYAKEPFSRVFLHAYLLYLRHPITLETMFFKAPLFEDMIGYLERNFPAELLDEVLFPDTIVERFSLFGERMCDGGIWSSRGNQR
ncbi:MAG: RluA family pseudouridine synthase [Wolinella sp.]